MRDFARPQHARNTHEQGSAHAGAEEAPSRGQRSESVPEHAAPGLFPDSSQHLGRIVGRQNSEKAPEMLGRV